MTALKKKDLDKFKAILVDEKKKIVQHLMDLTQSSEQELQNGSGDPADIASLEINQANIAKIGRRETTLLKKIDYALGKIEDKTYGECEECGEPIGIKRLEARPVAQLCIDCKTEQENTEKKFTSRDHDPDEDDYDRDSD